MPRTNAELLELLDLENIDDNLFRGAQQPSILPRVFGGQVAAQALVAADRTVDDEYVVHSLHSYFLQPGDTNAPIIYDVERLRDGRTFSTRRVLARQHGRPIFAMTVDLQRPEEGYEHQDRMPRVPSPEDALDANAVIRGEDGSFDEWDVIDFRYVGSGHDLLPPDDDRPGRQQMWLRFNEALPDDPLVHAAAFTYASDATLMGAALSPQGITLGGPEVMVASLDHSVWFHRPFRADDWWLFDQHSPIASGGRGLVNARVFDREGLLVASVSQEALMRPMRARGGSA
ncbi:Acyl-CoA thioesterase 2 [Nocardioides dokdonensis FR1436]|uniref:Acyl-CoA thioesterase 2 n=1 Tax=Nocardioides dokdonensis FR1436 TaxID=1300347 RepID=A0A1A9GNS3_9ACTN|nr:acyl-CoA thioesterase II [Nocardioides dokdonensis]ANH39944.1 Acyl-CoA thioesterase 2 [Nocardioides dokdonensis FR1436]